MNYHFIANSQTVVRQEQINLKKKLKMKFKSKQDQKALHKIHKSQI